MTAQWVKYDGSDEQIAEMWNAESGYILRTTKDQNDKRVRFAKESWSAECHFYDHCRSVKHVTHYLICAPHPYADMICQWARTGQPVWIRILGNVGINCAYSEYRWTGTHSILITNTPDWNIPGAEYSFTQFEGVV